MRGVGFRKWKPGFAFLKPLPNLNP